MSQVTDQNDAVFQDADVASGSSPVDSAPAKRGYAKPVLTVHGDMRAITHAIIGGDFNDGTFTGTMDGHPGFS